MRLCLVHLVLVGVLSVFICFPSPAQTPAERLSFPSSTCSSRQVHVQVPPTLLVADFWVAEISLPFCFHSSFSASLKATPCVTDGHCCRRVCRCLGIFSHRLEVSVPDPSWSCSRRPWASGESVMCRLDPGISREPLGRDPRLGSNRRSRNLRSAGDIGSATVRDPMPMQREARNRIRW